MFTPLVGAVLSLGLAQAPAANPACSLLTSAQVSSLIGDARIQPISSAPNGSYCMLQAGDKIITVTMVVGSSPEDATRAFDSKKRMLPGGADPGWGVPAYVGTQKKATAVVIKKGQTITEVKLLDGTQPPEVGAAKLTAVMKEVAGRK